LIRLRTHKRETEGLPYNNIPTSGRPKVSPTAIYPQAGDRRSPLQRLDGRIICDVVEAVSDRLHSSGDYRFISGV
jgi:hypothetical protein